MLGVLEREQGQYHVRQLVLRHFHVLVQVQDPVHVLGRVFGRA